MRPLRSDVVGAVNGFIVDQRKVPGECRLTFVQFDDQFDLVYSNEDIQKVKLLTDEDYVPRGNTALHGAIGRTIDMVGRDLAHLDEDHRPEHVIFVIQTDGLENNTPMNEWSKGYTGRVKEMIEHQTNVYGWQFLYLGANQDASLAGEAMGINRVNTMTFQHTSRGVADSAIMYSSSVAATRMGGSRTLAEQEAENK